MLRQGDWDSVLLAHSLRTDSVLVAIYGLLWHIIAMLMAHHISPAAMGFGMGLAKTPGSPHTRSPQGKVAELRQELNSGGKKDKNHSAKKIALKKIVANMTMSNNDMVALFPDIITCMELASLEIKKMSVTRLGIQRSL